MAFVKPVMQPLVGVSGNTFPLSLAEHSQRRNKGSDSERFPEETLQRSLFKNYLPTARPFTNDSFTTNVNFHLTLVKVIHINERSGCMEGEFLLWTNWEDARLSWKSDEFGGVEYINVPPTAIWTPNIILTNNAGNDYYHNDLKRAIVTSAGNVSLFETSKLKSSCDIDLSHFPKDTQKCQLTFSSATYDVSSLIISTFYEEYPNTSATSNNSMWLLMGITHERETTQQGCCQEYAEVTYVVKVKRNCQFCRHLYVMPVALLGLLVPFQFLLPINSRERSCFGCLLLIGCILMSTLLRDVIPLSMYPLPKLGIYYSLTTAYIAVSLLLTISTLHYCDTWRRRGNVPDIIKKIFIDVIGRLLCADALKVPLGASANVPITEVTDADTKNAGLEHQLEDVLNMLHVMTINMKRLRTEQTSLDEWRIVSLVLDRFFFVVFLVMYFITSLEFLG